MKNIEPKSLSKEEIESISSDVSSDELKLFEEHTLNDFIEPLVGISAKEPGSPWIRVKNREGNFKEILDVTSMNWTLSLGFAYPDVNYAAFSQMQKITHIRYNMVTPARAKLVYKLAMLSPGKLRGGKVSINCEGGGLAIEAAIKMALISSRKADHFGVFWGAYHGNSLVTGCASHPLHNITRYSDFGYDHFTRMPYPYCYRCLWNYKEGLRGEKDPSCNVECFEVVKQYIEGMAPKQFAGIILEPIQSGGGQVPAPPEFLRKLKLLCEEQGIYLIYDECQTSMWRCGKYFTITERYEKENNLDVSPDMMAFTKGIGGGYPIGALVVSPEIKARFNPREEHTTFSSDPLAMAASLTAIKVAEKEKLGENCEEIGNIIRRRLFEIQQEYEVIGDIRCPGLFIGVELVKDPNSRKPYNELCEEMVQIAPNHTLFLGRSSPIPTPKGKMIRRNVIMIKPPLIITENDAQFILERFEVILKEALNNIKK